MMTSVRDTDGNDDNDGNDPHPDLVGLTRYELSNATAVQAGDHLAACEECRSELAELVVGASVMGRAARTLASAAGTTAGTHLDASGDLPPLTLPPGRRALRRERWLLAAAAVTVFGALGALTVGLLAGGDTTPDRAEAPPVPDRRSVSLASVETTRPGQAPASDASGSVLMSAGEASTSLTFATTGLPEVSADEFYEAWLLDPSTDKMLPLGVFSGASDATFEVANSLLTQYAALDLSLETDDGDPTHSATSVLRGTY